MNKTIQEAYFGKKRYEKPYVGLCQIKSATILAGSGNSKQATQTEEYDVVSTDDWF